MSGPLKIPVTSSDRGQAEWQRKTATTVNQALSHLDAVKKQLAAPVDSVMFNPVALPGSPVKGQTVYDIADDKVKTWDGTAWQAHY